MSDKMDEALHEMRGMRDDVMMLTRGLISMNESVGNMNTTLQNLVDAMTDNDDDNNPTAEALRALTAAVNKSSTQVSQMREALTGAMLRGGPALSVG